MYQLLANSGLSNDEIKSAIASIQFIIKNSIRNNIDEQVLLKELINLGLPKGITHS